MDWTLLAAVVIPAVGWAISVEQRLTGKKIILKAVSEVSDKVAKLDKRQEDLIDFLLRDARTRVDQGRGF